MNNWIKKYYIDFECGINLWLYATVLQAQYVI